MKILVFMAIVVGGLLGWLLGGWDVRRMKRKYGESWHVLKWWHWR